ncbi:hydroxyisourate hydrolase [Aeromonas dhakensis]
MSLLLFSFIHHASAVNDIFFTYLLRTQVFDAALSKGVPGIKVELYKLSGSSSDDWIYIDAKITDRQGVVDDFLPYSIDGIQSVNGKYKLVYNTEGFYSPSDRSANYSKIIIEFDVSDARHSYIPISITRYGHTFK